MNAPTATVESIAVDLAALCAGLPDLDIRVERDGEGHWGALLHLDRFVQWGVRAPTAAGLTSALRSEGLASLRTDLEARRTGRPLPGRIAGPVVMEPMLAAVALHECVGHTSEADNFAEYGGRLGMSLGDRWTDLPLTVIDDPTLPGHCGSYDTDDEGTAAEPVTLVEDGRWTGLLTSGRYGSRSNGHGRGAGDPVPRMGVLVASGGTATASDLIGSVPDGFFLGALREGGSVREFVLLKPAWARRIRHGRLTDEIYTDLVLRGRKTQFMRRLRGIASDVTVADPYHRCEKYGRGVPVSLGAPHLMFEGLWLYPDGK
ncbi:metallopeptidase TldD-related protein [Streptomyces sp. NPDC056716]|uniref:metallopeptidase TldD-related protein n=1 Tax=unclassified Streptomyces TaxID=2593676 RepID=UPI003681D6DB